MSRSVESMEGPPFLVCETIIEKKLKLVNSMRAIFINYKATKCNENKRYRLYSIGKN